MVPGFFGLGQTQATTLTGIVIRLVTKIAAYTFGFYVNRLLGRPQAGSRSCGLEPDNTHLAVPTTVMLLSKYPPKAALIP